MQVVVIGESCLDEFVYCDVNRLAPDLPIPVLHEIRRVSNPGMAANVRRNLESRNRQCQILTNANWEVFKKTRYVHERSNHHFLRVDTPSEISPLKLNDFRMKADVVIISDYDKGFLTEDTISSLCENNDLVFLDSKKILGPWASSATFIKINDFEYQRSLPYLNDALAKKVIRTRGELGCDYLGVNYPVVKCEVKDASGAGDSFLAALVDEYLDSHDILASVIAANNAASRIVMTRGVGVI